MKTAFSTQRWEFTKAAHLAAQRQFYPRMFVGGVAFEDTVNTVRDLEYAIDCQLAVTVAGFRGPIRLAVQERFRDPNAMHHGDVTITEWNLATNKPSELHKLGAQLFVYGFYDQETDQIRHAVAIDAGLMQWSLANSLLPYVRQRRGDQSFIGIHISALRVIGAVLFEHNGRAQEHVA